MDKTTSKTKQIVAWCFYDWAVSAYFSVVTTFIFSAYFASQVVTNKVLGMYLWGNALGISAFIIALVSPIVGSIADYGGYRKRWLFVMTYLGVISSLGLWFAYPASAHVWFILFCVIIGNAALEIGFAFYNAILPSLISFDYLGRVSGWGWGMGYVGGLLCLSMALFIFVRGHLSFLDPSTFANIRICGPFIAIWLVVFSLPLFIWIRDPLTEQASAIDAIKRGFITLTNTVKSLRHNRSLLFFFISRACYIDGLNTVFAFGGIYAATTFHMSMEQVLVFAITLNLTAGIGAALFAWVDDWCGAIVTINISLLFLMVTTAVILVLHSTLIFWIVAAVMGLFIGPVQAASRSLLVRIVDAKTITEKFGLFSLSGKATAFFGPWLVAYMTMWFNSQRIGLSVIIVFYFLGLVTLTFVNEQEKSS